MCQIRGVDTAEAIRDAVPVWLTSKLPVTVLPCAFVRMAREVRLITTPHLLQTCAIRRNVDGKVVLVRHHAQHEKFYSPFMHFAH